MTAHGGSESVWVLDDPRASTSGQAIGIAERLGVPFRRIPVVWNWMANVAGLLPRGSLIGLAPPREAQARAEYLTAATAIVAARPRVPRLVISAGSRSSSVALWLKSRLGCAVVHCMRPGFVANLRTHPYDLLVVSKHDAAARARNVLAVTGVPHRLSPDALEKAGAEWSERLDHLPHPRIALLVGGARENPLRGPELSPALAHALGQHVARLAVTHGGAVMVTTSRRTGEEATEALAAGLRRSLHVLYRWGEPGENPYRGFLASADAIVVTADSVSMISEACGTTAPVFVALPELAGPRHKRLIATLTRAKHVCPLGDELCLWQRAPLDETGRIAAEIRRRIPLD
jgi:hypothetical protein